MSGYFSKLVTLNKIGVVCFHLIGTNGFHVKTENERFTAGGSRFRQNLNVEKMSAEKRLCSEM